MKIAFRPSSSSERCPLSILPRKRQKITGGIRATPDRGAPLSLRPFPDEVRPHSFRFDRVLPTPRFAGSNPLTDSPQSLLAAR